MVYHDPTEYNIEVSIVSTHPIWREHLDELVNYPFNQLGVDRLTAMIRADNKRSLKMINAIGFTHEGTVREGHNGIDIEIYGLLKREYYGQERKDTSNPGSS